MCGCMNGGAQCLERSSLGTTPPRCRHCAAPAHGVCQCDCFSCWDSTPAAGACPPDSTAGPPPPALTRAEEAEEGGAPPPFWPQTEGGDDGEHPASPAAVPAPVPKPAPVCRRCALNGPCTFVKRGCKYGKSCAFCHNRAHARVRHTMPQRERECRRCLELGPCTAIRGSCAKGAACGFCHNHSLAPGRSTQFLRAVARRQRHAAAAQAEEASASTAVARPAALGETKRLAAGRSAAPPAGRWRFSLMQDTKATRPAATIARCFVIALAARRPALSPPPLRFCRKRRAEITEDARTRSRSVSKGQRSTPASSQHGFTSSERSGSSAIALAEVNGAFKLCCAFICDKESAWRAAVATRWFVLANAAAALR